MLQAAAAAQSPGATAASTGAGTRSPGWQQPAGSVVNEEPEAGVRGRAARRCSSAFDGTFPCGSAPGLGALRRGESFGAVNWLPRALLPAFPERRRLKGESRCPSRSPLAPPPGRAFICRLEVCFMDLSLPFN